MRNRVRVLDVERFPACGRATAVMSVAVDVGGSDLALNGIGLVRAGSEVPATYPQYRHPRALKPTYAYGPHGDLRRLIEVCVLRRWLGTQGAEVNADPQEATRRRRTLS